MAEAAGIQLSALWCGQGMAHVLETFTEAEWQKKPEDRKPESMVLIDFGIEASAAPKKGGIHYQRAQKAIEFVAREAKKKDDPIIDLAISSHADADHWFLYPSLIELLKEGYKDKKDKDAEYVIKQFVKGGLQNSWGFDDMEGSKSALEEVEARVEDIKFIDEMNVATLESNLTNYRYTEGVDENALPFIKDIDGVKIRTLIANVSTGKMDAHGINTCSLVVVIDFKGKRMILPGDATQSTLIEVNKLLDKWKGKSPLKPVLMMSVPHHGARSTMLQEGEVKGVDQSVIDGYQASIVSKRKRSRSGGLTRNSKKKKVTTEHFHALGKFTALTQPAAIVASADHGTTTAGHPSAQVLQILGKYTKHGGYSAGVVVDDHIGDHTIVVADASKVTKGWSVYSFNQNNAANVFTTRLTTSESANLKIEGEDKTVNVSDFYFMIDQNGAKQTWKPYLADQVTSLVTKVQNIEPCTWDFETQGENVTMTDAASQPVGSLHSGEEAPQDVVGVFPPAQTLVAPETLNPMGANRSRDLQTLPVAPPVHRVPLSHRALPKPS
ncbi:hypothetical protein [Acanthopleuribacter pedis]|uniref:Uncharacterized protein n=1 Tax=Acanthopleuribacter pedis TaxID=442870 RepID=A0A8J7U563_9BACT|nr:hypothetical protein [Acanthopleuribacter pedis]MBO1321377.1 hypothetical protein [Acanthopleuribacter pedis]